MKYLFLTAFMAGMLLAQPVWAVDERGPHVKVFGSDHTELQSWPAFEDSFTGGGTVAIGHLEGKKKDLEVVVGSGPGRAPVVSVFSSHGNLIRQFAPYPDHMRAGVNVAAGDVDGDGWDEIITGTMRDGGPHIRVFNQQGQPVYTTGFFAFDSGFRGGVSVAAADVNGDGVDEIVAGAGVGGGPQVRLFDKHGNFTGTSFFVFAQSDRGGVSVARANVDGGKEDEVVVGLQGFGKSWVKVYKPGAGNQVLGSFTAFDDSFYGGVEVAGADVDQDGVDEILVTPHTAGGPQIRAFEAHGKTVPYSFFAYEEEFRGGLRLAAADLDHSGDIELVTIPSKKMVEGRLDQYKYIDVNVSEQRLRAYRGGKLERTFLVSTGTTKYPSPIGDFEVLQKVFMKDYKYSYGENHPDNYDLPNVKYNLRFNGPYFLHYAYWHNNFGHRMSHGCVNINLENAEWMYTWADIGNPVYVHY